MHIPSIFVQCQDVCDHFINIVPVFGSTLRVKNVDGNGEREGDKEECGGGYGLGVPTRRSGKVARTIDTDNIVVEVTHSLSTFPVSLSQFA